VQVKYYVSYTIPVHRCEKKEKRQKPCRIGAEILTTGREVTLRWRIWDAIILSFTHENARKAGRSHSSPLDSGENLKAWNWWDLSEFRDQRDEITLLWRRPRNEKHSTDPFRAARYRQDEDRRTPRGIEPKGKTLWLFPRPAADTNNGDRYYPQKQKRLRKRVEQRKGHLKKGAATVYQTGDADCSGKTRELKPLSGNSSMVSRTKYAGETSTQISACTNK